MPNITAPSFSLPAKSFPGSPNGAPSGLAGELLFSGVLGKYATLAKAGKLQSAYATLTAPVIYSTAAGTGGPFIWNRPSSGIDAHLLAVGFSSSVVTTVAGGLGVTGGPQAVPISASTAIDASGNCLIGGPVTQMGLVARVATVVNAGAQFVPFAQFHTGALTVDTTGLTWVDLDGMFIVPPGTWGAVAATATLTTLQVAVALVWAELPA